MNALLIGGGQLSLKQLLMKLLCFGAKRVSIFQGGLK
jgi:hypothetical protein